jgi:hypothetical protein
MPRLTLKTKQNKTKTKNENNNNNNNKNFWFWLSFSMANLTKATHVVFYKSKERRNMFGGGPVGAGGWGRFLHGPMLRHPFPLRHQPQGGIVWYRIEFIQGVSWEGSRARERQREIESSGVEASHDYMVREWGREMGRGGKRREDRVRVRNKRARVKPGVVAHAFNPSTREAEAGRFLSSRPAWSTE